MNDNQVLFLGIGAALRARLAENHGFAFGCVTSQGSSVGRRVGLAEKRSVTTRQSHSPVH